MEMAMIVLSFTTDLITQWMCKTGLGGRIISEKNVWKFQALVVRKVDNAIQPINHYPADSVVCFVNTYPLDSDLSDG